jgi:GT2 family glycosyltransferase
MQMRVDLSVIIVNWNTREFLRRCLESLPLACGSVNYEVWVVDNASADGSAECVRQHFQSVNLITNIENVGFAAANNQAAQKANGRYLLLLNPDTEPLPKSIAGLGAYADAHPEIGVIGPRLLNSDGSDQRSCWRGYPGLEMAIVDAFYLWKLSWIPVTWLSEYRPDELRQPHLVDHLLGACILIRRSAWEKVGPLDERYFLGSEETDWCYRARKLGWQIVFHPGYQVVHHGQKSAWQQPSKNLPHLYSGYLRFYCKHHGGGLRLGLLNLILALGAFIRTGLWTVRWLAARSDESRKQAAAMVRGYWRVLAFLPGELCQARVQPDAAGSNALS